MASAPNGNKYRSISKLSYLQGIKTRFSQGLYILESMFTSVQMNANVNKCEFIGNFRRLHSP